MSEEEKEEGRTEKNKFCGPPYADVISQSSLPFILLYNDCSANVLCKIQHDYHALSPRTFIIVTWSQMGDQGYEKIYDDGCWSEKVAM